MSPFGFLKKFRRSLDAQVEADEPAPVTAALEDAGLHIGRTTDRFDGGMPGVPKGETYGRFEVMGEIARGGMGRILEARDAEIGRTVALKVLRTTLSVEEQQIIRFVAEAKITGQLQHPNIVPVHEIGATSEGELYFVMKRVDGRSLRELVDDLAASPELQAEWSRARLLRVFLAVCNAVAYAHDRGVLHRDLKPANVMVGAFGEVLVMDWGVARLLDAAEFHDRDHVVREVTVGDTEAGAVVGSAGYMSPEQARAEGLDERSDVWSLGAILYELLTLCAPYEGANYFFLLAQTDEGPPEDPRTRAPGRDIPDEIAAVCMQALAQSPEDRFPSASALGSAVEAFLEGSRKREEAERRVAEGERTWARYLELLGDARAVGRIAARAVRALSDDAPRAQVRQAWSQEDQAREAMTRAEMARDRVVQLAHRALAHHSDSPSAHDLLARVYHHRHVDAEARRDVANARRFEQFLRAHNNGTYSAYLAGSAPVRLVFDREVRLSLAKVVPRERVLQVATSWQVAAPDGLDQSLDAGSWLIDVYAKGRAHTIYPVHVRRAKGWDCIPPAEEHPEPIRIPRADALGADDVYVPGGWFLSGGDPEAAGAGSSRRVWVSGFVMRRFPVTVAELAAFLDSPAASQAAREGLRDGGGRWRPRWPAVHVTWETARAFAAWEAERTGLAWRLPYELEWEKAARGVDGRWAPWGDFVDPSFCRMRREMGPEGERVSVDSHPLDDSPYGVRGLGGNVRDWCLDAPSDEPAVTGRRAALRSPTPSARRVVRGGSFRSGASEVRSAARATLRADRRHPDVGFRLCRPLTDADV